VRAWYKLVKGGTFPFNFGRAFDGNACWTLVENGFCVGEQHVLGSDGVRLYYADERAFLEEVEHEYKNVAAENRCEFLRSIDAANSDDEDEYQGLFTAKMRMDVPAFAHVEQKFGKKMEMLTKLMMSVNTEGVVPACPARIRKAMIRGVTEAADHLLVKGPRAYVDGALMHAMQTFCEDLRGVYTVTIISGDVVHVSGEGRHVAPFACTALASYLTDGKRDEVRKLFDFETLVKTAAEKISDPEYLKLAIGLCARAACYINSRRCSQPNESFRNNDRIFANVRSLGHAVMFCSTLTMPERLTYSNTTSLFLNFDNSIEWVFALVASYSKCCPPYEGIRKCRKLYNGEGNMYADAQQRFSGGYDTVAAREYFKSLKPAGDTTSLNMITSSMFYPSFFSVYENAVTPYVQFITGASKTMLTSENIHSRAARKK